MSSQRQFWIYWLVTWITAAAPTIDGPSEVQFKSGGSLRVSILSESNDGKQKFTVLQTNSGGILKLENSKAIERITGSQEDYDEYRQFVAKLDKTTQSHWTLYQWCRERERRVRFKDEALFHLRQIVKLDPSDERAWRSFRSVDPDKAFIEINGQWVPEQQHYLASGYTKIDGHWVSKLQIDANAEQASLESLQNDRKERLKKWHRHVLPKEDVDAVRSKLFEIVDPISIEIIESLYLEREKDPRIRALYLEAIGQVATANSQRVLVKYFMTDPEPIVREQAMVGLENKEFSPDRTASLLSQFLKSADNDQINRAARIIGRLGSEAAINQLIDALVTTHLVSPGGDPGRMSTTFDNSGGMGLTMGATPPKKANFQNEDVLAALESITSQRFGYDQQLWRHWYISRYTTIERDIRRDFDTD